MRPELLNPLFAEVEALKGVGPQVARLLHRLDLTRLVDLLFHLPTGTIERVRVGGASEAVLGSNVILRVTPFEARSSAGRGRTRSSGRYGTTPFDSTMVLSTFASTRSIVS